MPAARAAFEGLIDYAGLYPPASLPLEKVVRNYAAYRSGADSCMLGRLIVPVEKLAELEVLARDAGATNTLRWPVSVLVGGAQSSAENSQLILGALEASKSALAIESIEAVATSEQDIAAIGDAFPTTI